MAFKTSDAPIPISVVSNSQLLHEGLPELLKQHFSVCVVGCYRADQLGEAVENPAEHVVLLDANIGQRNVLAWTHWWRARHSPPRVMVLELSDDVGQILDCVEAGAGSYTLQGASIAEVAEAIRDLREGIVRCSPEVAAEAFARLAAQPASSSARRMQMIPLTRRELEVLYCIAKGSSNKEIAARLNIEVYTVKHHVHSILAKLNTKGRWQAVNYAQQQGWLPRGNHPSLLYD